MRPAFNTSILSLFVGWIAGIGSVIIWKGGEKAAVADSAVVSHKPTLPVVSAKGVNPSAPVSTNANGATSEDESLGQTSDTMRLEIPTATLKSLSRYLRFPPWDPENVFQPSRELIELFGLTEAQVNDIKRNIQSSFDDLAKAETANAILCTDEQKGDYFKLKPIDSADQLRANFTKSMGESLGEATGLAVASILTNSGIFADFGSYPRVMYLDERKADDGASYFMLTQQRIAEDLDENKKNFGSTSMFITKADIEKRFGGIYAKLSPKAAQKQ